jgi:hypothetical protein
MPPSEILLFRFWRDTNGRPGGELERPDGAAWTLCEGCGSEIAFVPAPDHGEQRDVYHQLEVKVARPGLAVRTSRYYPQ